jgi:hypothetical protein
MSLCSLVYVSIAFEEMTDDDLLRLLEAARKNNAQFGITGVLLYRERFFIQALEGEAHDVDRLFEVIKQDPRHYNVLPIYKSHIDRRSFSQWAMGFDSPNFDALKQIDGFSDFMRPHPADGFDNIAQPLAGTVESLLQGFRQ